MNPMGLHFTIPIASISLVLELSVLTLTNVQMEHTFVLRDSTVTIPIHGTAVVASHGKSFASVHFQDTKEVLIFVTKLFVAKATSFMIQEIIESILMSVHLVRTSVLTVSTVLTTKEVTCVKPAVKVLKEKLVLVPILMSVQILPIVEKVIVSTVMAVTLVIVKTAMK